MAESVANLYNRKVWVQITHNFNCFRNTDAVVRAVFAHNHVEDDWSCFFEKWFGAKAAPDIDSLFSILVDVVMECPPGNCVMFCKLTLKKKE